MKDKLYGAVNIEFWVRIFFKSSLLSSEITEFDQGSWQLHVKGCTHPGNEVIITGPESLFCEVLHLENLQSWVTFKISAVLLNSVTQSILVKLRFIVNINKLKPKFAQEIVDRIKKEKTQKKTLGEITIRQ